MTSRDFVYWLQGFFELTNTDTITPEQVKLIKKHLNLVFKHEIDPSMGDEKHQSELNDIHNESQDKKNISKIPQSNDGLQIRC